MYAEAERQFSSLAHVKNDSCLSSRYVARSNSSLSITRSGSSGDRIRDFGLNRSRFNLIHGKGIDFNFTGSVTRLCNIARLILLSGAAS